jgi:hypothetical protein
VEKRGDGYKNTAIFGNRTLDPRFRAGQQVQLPWFFLLREKRLSRPGSAEGGTLTANCHIGESPCLIFGTKVSGKRASDDSVVALPTDGLAERWCER